MKKYLEHSRIIKNAPLNSSIYHLVLYAPEIAREARPGQFVMVRVTNGLIPLLRRPFSLYRIRNDEGTLEIIYKVVGKGTAVLSRAREGDFIDILGPLGNGFRLPPHDVRNIWILAGGIGIAAVRPLMEKIREEMPQTNLVLYYGARSSFDLIDLDDFSGLCYELKCSTDDGSFGFCGSVLGCAVHDWETSGEIPSYVYACGPPVMLYHAAGWVLERGIPSQFSLESLMGCGVGACLGCALPKKSKQPSLETSYVHVCFEGPVFSPDVIDWERFL